MRNHHQKLPSNGPEREALREKGQFWTPDWVAQAMVSYVVSGGSSTVFDPAVGEGVFLRAAKIIAKERGKRFKLQGTELDPETLHRAKQHGLSESDLANVQITDFVLHPPKGPIKAIVANPPYIRHHRLPMAVKEKLRAFGASLIGTPLDGRAGFHVYFLLRALELLDVDGRLSFIMPADTCEGVFAPTLWNWLTHRYQLEAVITFAPEASPFPGVDTNAIIFMIRNAAPKDKILWVKCRQPETDHLKTWVQSGFKSKSDSVLDIHWRDLEEALSTGFSRPPADERSTGPKLGLFAKVLRGIATGDNDFFFLSAKQASDLKLPDEFLLPAVGRTRDVQAEEITFRLIKDLESKERPTLLFSPDGRPISHFPHSVQKYLKQGEERGLNKRALIGTRNPWYKMEIRQPPPFLFAYLGRRNARFIRNTALVTPLTGFLCVYPRQKDLLFVEKLWKILQHPETVANLSLVGKSYGDGAIKVEPRALERLPLPISLASELEPETPFEAVLSSEKMFSVNE